MIWLKLYWSFHVITGYVFVTEILCYFNVNANNIMIPIPCLITQYDNTCHKLGDEDTLPSL